VSTGTAGLIDTYLFDPVVPFTPPVSGTGIKGVQLMVASKKDDTGAATVTGCWQAGGGGSPIIATPNFPPSEDSYICQWTPARLSVFTSSDWTQTEVNSLEAGMKRIE
jgi:hypothetical protein